MTHSVTPILVSYILKLRFPYATSISLKLAPNLALQWHYRILQALALDEDLPEKPEDKTIPKYRQIAKVSDGFTAIC